MQPGEDRAGDEERANDSRDDSETLHRNTPEVSVFSVRAKTKPGAAGQAVAASETIGAREL
jgi:hypothetical protein